MLGGGGGQETAVDFSWSYSYSVKGRESLCPSLLHIIQNDVQLYIELRPFLLKAGYRFETWSSKKACFPLVTASSRKRLSSVLVTPAPKRPFYELSLDTVRDVFYVGHISATPFQVLTKYRKWMGIDHFIGSTSPWQVSTDQEIALPKKPCNVWR